MVGPDGLVPSSPSLPGPSSSNTHPAAVSYYPQFAPQPPSRSKGKEPARGRSRFREWGEEIIEEPSRAYPYNERVHPASSEASAAATPTTTTTGPSSTNGSNRGQRAPQAETVGSLLADIANCLSDTLQMLRFSDQRHWGTDEHEQVHRLEEALDDAAKDFQELSPLVNGQFYYENDRNVFSVAEMSQIRDLFQSHQNTFREWLKGGGPINPLWATETSSLRKTLHLAQCRAAGRIFASQREESHRCLGAHLVQRAGPDLQRIRRHRQSLASIPERDSLGSISDNASRSSLTGSVGGMSGLAEEHEQVAACNTVGKFERLGDRDIAFVCDYCDGYIVWEDLSDMPSTRLKRSPQDQAREHRRSRDKDFLLAMSKPQKKGPRELILPRYRAEQQLVEMEVGSRSSMATSSDPGTRSSIISDTPTTTSTTTTLLGGDGQRSEYSWMASGISCSSVEDDPNSPPVEKTIVFAPIAIANHVPPEGGEWQARLLCPYCDDWIVYSQGDNEMEAVRYAQDENGFESQEKLREHLEWYHAPGYLETIASPVQSAASTNGCVMM